jgi:DNA-binding response OmpR family regulator
MTLSTDPAPDERPLVVVIEDEADLRQLVVFNLRAEGFHVMGAATAGEGLAICAMHRPAVVVLDRMLGDVDGIDLCTHLRSDEHLADVAVLVLSALGSRRDRRTGFDAGADDYVVKPFVVRDLVERVRSLAFLSVERVALRSVAR